MFGVRLNEGFISDNTNTVVSKSAEQTVFINRVFGAGKLGPFP